MVITCLCLPPATQSIVRASIAQDFISSFELKKVPGFGPVVQERAKALGIENIGQLQDLSREELVRKCNGDGDFAARLWEIAGARDDTVIENSGPAKTIGQEKRQRTNTLKQRDSLLQWLAYKLCERVQVDQELYARRPTLVVFKWGSSEAGWKSWSRRCALPFLDIRAGKGDSGASSSGEAAAATTTTDSNGGGKPSVFDVGVGGQFDPQVAKASRLVYKLAYTMMRKHLVGLGLERC